MLSYSNFGSDKEGSPVKVSKAVKYMQEQYPDLAIDGEMQVNFAMDTQLRDAKYPLLFTRKKCKYTSIPNINVSNTGYKLIKSMNGTEHIGPIQMGLNKPIHFTDIESSVRDIVNITAVAAIDAIVLKKQKRIINSMQRDKKKEKLSRTQVICIILLWAAFMFIIFTQQKK